jgi:hypothetical protein
MAKSKRKRVPKTVLKLPDLEQSKSAVLNSLTSESSKRSYDHAIREFIDWYCSEPRLAFNRTVVTRYRIALEQHPYAPSTINLRLAAIRRLAYEASDCGLLSPDLAAGIRRVKGVRRLGVRVGNWLTAEARAQPIESSTVRLAISRRATFPQYVRCVCLSPLRPCSQCRSSCPYPCEACRTRLPRSHLCEAESTDALARGALLRSSDEAG